MHILALINIDKKNWYAVVIFSFVINLLLLVPIWYVFFIFDNVLPSSDIDTLIGISFIAIFLLICFGFIENYRQKLLVIISDKTEKFLLSQTLQRFNLIGAKDITNIEIIEKISTIKKFISGNQILNYIDLPFIFLFCFLLALVNFEIFLVTLSCVITIYLLSKASSTINLSMEKIVVEKIKEKNELSLLEKTKSSIIFIHLLEVLTKNFFSNIEKNNIKITNINLKNSEIQASLKFVRLFFQSLIYGLATYLCIIGEISIGTIIAATILHSRIVSVVENIIFSIPKMKKFLFDFDKLINISYKKLRVIDAVGDIDLKNFKLSWNEVKPSNLNNPINIRIKKGKLTLILGENGSGKSLFIKTILGLSFPKDGSINFDNKKIEFNSNNIFTKNLGYFSSEQELLNCSIAQFISNFDPDNSHQLILKSAKMADIHKIIDHMEYKYETQLSKKNLLSNTQIKKLLLARSFYADPQTLILDEPLLGLDQTSKHIIIKSIGHFKNNLHTLLICENNPILIDLADDIIYLEDGKLKCFLPRDEFLKNIKNH